MTNETLFTKIINREIPADIVFETDQALAFRDIAPQAPVHILIIPKKPLPDIASASSDDRDLLGDLFLVAVEVAAQEGLSSNGYRLVVNTGQDGGQEVPHLHIHLLGGRALKWPPG